MKLRYVWFLLALVSTPAAYLQAQEAASPSFTPSAKFGLELRFDLDSTRVEWDKEDASHHRKCVSIPWPSLYHCYPLYPAAEDKGPFRPGIHSASRGALGGVLST